MIAASTALTTNANLLAGALAIDATGLIHRSVLWDAEIDGALEQHLRRVAGEVATLRLVLRHSAETANVFEPYCD